jgi:hypothetical protein
MGPSKYFSRKRRLSEEDTLIELQRPEASLLAKSRFVLYENDLSLRTKSAKAFQGVRLRLPKPGSGDE